jgi:Holliday junction resolvase-like predicted endonuclease|tara:strand:- start:388 stop:681 length:294 start_codon:yes stop_codon:yes gene_type:complete
VSVIPYSARIAKGQSSEFYAASWLSAKGYNIYWRTLDNDPIDLVAIDKKKRKIILIDVKTASTRKKGTLIARTLTPFQKKLGVKILYVFKDGSCKFK